MEVVSSASDTERRIHQPGLAWLGLALGTIFHAMSSHSSLAPMNFPWLEVAGLGVVAAGSLGIGLLINGCRQAPLPLVYRSPADRLVESVGRLSAAEQAPGGWRRIELDDFQDRVATHRGMVIDARPAAFYRKGHVPGAVNVPRTEFENVYPEIRARIEPAKTVGIAVYCSESDCEDSELVADALARLGYRHLTVFKGGWDEWSRAGLPEEIAASR